MVYSSHPTKLKTVNPSLKYCLACKDKLQYWYQFSANRIWTLEGPIRLRRNTFTCDNKDCFEYKKPITAPDESPKHHTVGYDVLLFIGLLRVNLGVIAKKVQKKLEIEHKLFISEPQINNLADKYLKLLGNRPHDKLLQQLRDRGNVILDLDGVKPEKGNKVLYLIRDCRSGIVLLARTLKFSNTDQLELLLEEIQLMELDVIGVVSDKQKSIVDAVARVYSDVPHQFCQFHYLKNIAKDFGEADLSLRKNIRKDVKAITRTSKTVNNQYKAKKLNSDEYTVLGNLYDRIKHILTWSAKYPFNTVGIELYENIIKIESIIKDMSKIRHVNVFKTMLKHCKLIKQEYKLKYKILKEQRAHLYRINEILQSGNNNHEALEQRIKEKQSKEAELLKYVENIARRSKRKKASVVQQKLVGWYEELVKTTRSWLPGLFSYCLEPFLEKTNNLLEQSIKDLKQSLKHLLNNKLIHRYLLRRGEFLVFGLQNGELLTEEELLNVLMKNGGEVEKVMEDRFENLADHFKVDRRCKADFDKEMKDILKTWRSIS